MQSVYGNRPVSRGYPDLEKLGVEYYAVAQDPHSRVQETLQCLETLIDVSEGPRTVAIVGCGPKPSTLKVLLDRGFDAVGIEPLVGSVEAAAHFIGDGARVLRGSAECVPLDDGSQRIVLMENVLEHVDSPGLALKEAYRLLVGGGVLFVYTTNRLKCSLTGKNAEFRKRFYNWFPDIVKESYIYKHLHYDPRLANYAPRPAVHWFTFADLCRLGRQVGFAQFYSLLDLVDLGAASVSGHVLRRMLLNRVRYNPWLRAVALTQYGNSIFMFKREE